MRKRITAFLAVTVMLISALTLSGCTTSHELEKIVVGEVTHSIFYAPQYAAMALGYFEDEGLEIELVNSGGADKVMTALISEGIDIGLAGPEACVYVYNEGSEDYAQVFAQLTACDGSFLMAREPNEDFDFSNLEGAHILPGRVGGVPYMALRFAIEKSGLDPNEDMNMDTSIQFENMTAAFLNGTGDYVTMFEPTASSVQAEGKGYIVASVGEHAGPMPYTAYFATKSYIAENESVMQKFTDAIAKGQAWVAENSAEDVAKCVEQYFADTDIEILVSAVQSYKDIGAYSKTPVMTEEGFDNLQTVIMQAGELDEKAPFEDLINNKYAQAAVE